MQLNLNLKPLRSVVSVEEDSKKEWQSKVYSLDFMLSLKQ